VEYCATPDRPRDLNLFIILGNVPFAHDDKQGVTAVHLVTYELLGVLKRLGNKITLQVLFNSYRAELQLTADEQTQLKQLESDGIAVLPVLSHLDYPRRSRALPRRLATAARRLFFGPMIADYYPSIHLNKEVLKRVHKSESDAILTMWCPEGLAATWGERTIPRVSYQGDVDFVPAEVRARDPWLFPPGASETNHFLHKLRKRFDMAQFKSAHMRLMKGVDLIANVTASNADFYRKHGHSSSVYVRNTWPDRGRPNWERLNHKDADPIRIIGHMGYLNRTGGTYGLKCLLVDLLPELEREMTGLNYEVHIIGGGEISPVLKPYLQNKRVVLRGFVPDLQAEMEKSHMVLLLNNAGPYQAAYTRHLAVWASGLCLIVHENSRRAIPEIVHMENALVGATTSEIARHVKSAATDFTLNRRLRQAGRETYETYFRPELVGKTLAECLSKGISVKKP
jgi:hypothetical protein